MSGRGLGWVPPKRWPTPQEIAHSHARLMAAQATTFTPTTLGTPTILDQGGTGSCFGFAAEQGMFLDCQVNGIPRGVFSPAIPYWFARREAVTSDDAIQDIGSDPDSMIQALADFGSCALDQAPFVEADVNQRPPDAALIAAQKMRATLSPIIATGSALYDAIRHVIQVERKPVLIALEVVPDFDNCPGGVVDDPSGRSRGGHANCIFGFSDEGLLDANSWGLGWGNNGTATLTPRFVAGAVTWAGSIEVNQ